MSRRTFHSGESATRWIGPMRNPVPGRYLEFVETHHYAPRRQALFVYPLEHLSYRCGFVRQDFENSLDARDAVFRGVLVAVGGVRSEVQLAHFNLGAPPPAGTVGD